MLSTFISLIVLLLLIYLLIKLFTAGVLLTTIIYVFDHPLKTLKFLGTGLLLILKFAITWEIKPVVDILTNPVTTIHTYCFKNGALCGHKLVWYILYYWVLRYIVLSIIIQIIFTFSFSTVFLIKISRRV